MPVALYSSASVDSLLATKGNFGDAFSIGKVQDVSASGGYWVITFAPVNATLMTLGLSVSLSDGSSSEAITSNSSTSTWTHTTTTIADTSTIFLTFNGQRSTLAICTV